jgi:multifunctional methyltransferase subunit TRM112
MERRWQQVRRFPPMLDIFIIIHHTHNICFSVCLGLCFCRTEKGYPLIIEATHIQQAEVSSPMNRPMLLKLLPKINYDALVQACRQLAPQIILSSATDSSKNVAIPDLPETLPPSILEESSNNNNDDDLLVSLHKVLFDIHIVEGFLICPDTGRRFPIKNSIPNMILHEDEI